MKTLVTFDTSSCPHTEYRLSSAPRNIPKRQHSLPCPGGVSPPRRITGSDIAGNLGHRKHTGTITMPRSILKHHYTSLNRVDLFDEQPETGNNIAKAVVVPVIFGGLRSRSVCSRPTPSSNTPDISNSLRMSGSRISGGVGGGVYGGKESEVNRATEFRSSPRGEPQTLEHGCTDRRVRLSRLVQYNDVGGDLSLGMLPQASIEAV